MNSIRKFESIQEAVNALGQVIALHHLNNGYSLVMKQRLMQEKRQREIRETMQEKAVRSISRLMAIPEDEAKKLFGAFLSVKGKNFYQMKAMAYTDDSWRYYRSLV